MGFFTTVLYFILGIYIFGFLLRLASPYILKFIMKRFEKKMGGFNQYETHQQPKTKKEPLSKTNEIEGEYIDFEELEEDD